MDGFEESGFEGISDIENAIAAIGEAAWPIRADMGERRHQIRCTVSAYPPVRWHKVQIADGRHDPGIGLLLCRDQQRPVGGVGDVLEQVDRRKGAAEDPDSAFPLNMGNRALLLIRHQPPRSASR